MELERLMLIFRGDVDREFDCEFGCEFDGDGRAREIVRRTTLVSLGSAGGTNNLTGAVAFDVMLDGA
jgi:hypothetical protein